MPENVPQLPDGVEKTPAKSGFWTVQRIVIAASAVLILIPVLVFVLGILLAGGAEQTASWVQVVRDTLIIALILEATLIFLALAVLVLQIARLANLVQSEAKPIFKNAQDTVAIAKGTTTFIGNTAVEPVIKVSSFWAGARVFIREVGGIRRAIRRTPQKEQNHVTE
ncbi:MAG: hypothetical protein K8I60_17680 [Anaerolineae bacterium]|nr:hypothetical protein [Anaerolineae bacterium]